MFCGLCAPASVSEHVARTNVSIVSGSQWVLWLVCSGQHVRVCGANECVYRGHEATGLKLHTGFFFLFFWVHTNGPTCLHTGTSDAFKQPFAQQHALLQHFVTHIPI